MDITYIQILEEELLKYGLMWCRECNEGNHKRGFVLYKDKKVIHLNSTIKTRSSLFRALHEIGHCVNDETGLRSYEKEERANRLAITMFKARGLSIPREVRGRWKRYVERKKRHGDRIKSSKKVPA